MTIPQGQVKILNIADIVWNPRYREDMGDIDTLTESVKEKGILQPITVSPDMELLAGMRRLTAAKAAGLTKIPALVRKVDGEIDAREIELIENVFRKDFTWQEEAALIQEIDRLYKAKHIAWSPKEGGGMQPGWSSRKTAELLGRSVMDVSRKLKLAAAITVMPELSELKTADDAFKTIKKMEESVVVDELRKRQTVSMQTGDGIGKGVQMALRVADTNYHIGDTFKGLAELRSNGSVHVIECDPPYGIDLTKLKASKESVTSNVHKYDEIAKENYPAFLEKLTKELYRVAGEHSWLIFWFGPTWQHEVLEALRAAKWQVDEIPAVWVKEQGQTLQPEVYFARGYEPFYMCRKGMPALIKRGRLNVFNYSGVAGAKKIHPTERPVEMMEDLLSCVGLPQSILLVPFLGSGNTLRAAYNLGMKCYGWDISSEYKDKFMLRIEDDARALLTNGDNEGEEDK